MKIGQSLWLAGMCMALITSGCVSIPTSPTPRYYALTPIDENKAGADLVSVREPGAIIGIGPVKVPEYLNRPQIVTIEKDKTLKFDEFNRWAEPLDTGVARLIREDLSAMLPGAKLILYPWDPSITVKYKINVEIVQLDSTLDGQMSFVAQWTVMDAQSSKVLIIKRSEFYQPIDPHNYSGFAKALSISCASLSKQIVEALGSLN